MNNFQKAAMAFAVSSKGRIVQIDDVENGASCDCSCPHCGASLIAKNGGHERAHHFAHDSLSESIGCAETAIHLAAKQIIADYKRVILPRALDDLDTEESVVAELDEVKLEYTLCNPVTQDWIVADCYANNNAGSVIIEIAVSHRVDDYKASKIRDLGIPAMEIDLSDQLGKLWTWENLENAVLFDSNRRQWICPPQNTPTLPEVTSVPNSALELHEWRFTIGATWIWVKELPFGNVRVFHRFDEHARLVVEPICRKRGYWNGKYKNWIVFDQFKAELLQLLASHATPH